jgi:aminobenzoyl-glutamate utilization protein B
MEGYRPLLEALRYDPSRFATYLEQLGIEYPTLRRQTAQVEDAKRD